MSMMNNRFNAGDRVETRIGDAVIVGTASPAGPVWGHVNPKDYVNIRDDAGRNHLALRRSTRPVR